jgi:hypothetical protein
VARPVLMVTFGSSWVSIVELLNPSVYVELIRAERAQLAERSHKANCAG